VVLSKKNLWLKFLVYCVLCIYNYRIIGTFLNYYALRILFSHTSSFQRVFISIIFGSLKEYITCFEYHLIVLYDGLLVTLYTCLGDLMFIFPINNLITRRKLSTCLALGERKAFCFTHNYLNIIKISDELTSLLPTGNMHYSYSLRSLGKVANTIIIANIM